jgi:hypothetical protein
LGSTGLVWDSLVVFSFIILISLFLLIEVDVGIGGVFLLLVLLLFLSYTGFIILSISWASRFKLEKARLCV